MPFRSSKRWAPRMTSILVTVDVELHEGNPVGKAGEPRVRLLRANQANCVAIPRRSYAFHHARDVGLGRRGRPIANWKTHPPHTPHFVSRAQQGLNSYDATRQHRI